MSVALPLLDVSRKQSHRVGLSVFALFTELHVTMFSVRVVTGVGTSLLPRLSPAGLRGRATVCLRSSTGGRLRRRLPSVVVNSAGCTCVHTFALLSARSGIAALLSIGILASCVFWKNLLWSGCCACSRTCCQGPL